MNTYKMSRQGLSTVLGIEKMSELAYEEAVKTLNTLQTNFQTLEKIRQEKDRNAHKNIPNMLNYLNRTGITQTDIDRLNVIHVSGTKGKGSTCAYCESILRHHGYKTGFFSSPHLVEVRERLRVNGSPVEREKFTKYFWDVYNKLDQTKDENDGLMPTYFGFLTVMSLHMFLQEQVDVAIMEVGIGGQYDCTNVIKHPVVCGVTSLGLDHTSILGKTKDKIAWHKAGIFKPGVPAFTAPQCPEAMGVLQQRAKDIGCPLFLSPDMNCYETPPRLGIQGSVQVTNASLALQLCHTWISRHKRKHEGEAVNQSVPASKTEDCGSTPPVASPIMLTPPYLQGLERCRWLGRNQKISTPGISFYLDGAHTLESIQQCTEWFQSESKKEAEESRSPVYRVLIFNTTKERDPEVLLRPLKDCHFDAVLFCPNVAYESSISADQTNNNVSKETQTKQCLTNKRTWEKLTQAVTMDTLEVTPVINGVLTHNLDIASGSKEPLKSEIHTQQNGHSSTRESSMSLRGMDSVLQNEGRTKHDSMDERLKTEIHVFSSVSCCVNWLCEKTWIGKEEIKGRELHENNKEDSPKVDDLFKTNNHPDIHGDTDEKDCENSFGLVGNGVEEKQIQVLISGSLHLVGAALKVIRDLDI